MKSKTVFLRQKGDVRAEIYDDGYGFYLATTRNGFHWTSVSMPDDLLELTIDVLQRFQEMRKAKNTGDKIMLSFEQRVIDAALQVKEGDPIKDFLSQEDINEAVCRLADVYTALGFVLDEDS